MRKLGFRSVKQRIWYCTVNCTTEIWTFPFPPLTVNSRYLVMFREPPIGMSSIWHYVKSPQTHCGSWSSEIFLPIITIGILSSRTTKVLAICIKLVAGPCLHPHFSLHQVFFDSSLSLLFALKKSPHLRREDILILLSPSKWSWVPRLRVSMIPWIVPLIQLQWVEW